MIGEPADEASTVRTGARPSHFEYGANSPRRGGGIEIGHAAPPRRFEFASSVGLTYARRTDLMTMTPLLGAGSRR